ncbi:MAG: YwiC-like family protein [Anaerolineae bacterium]|nr:YwiC-like family protein [Anaerolineae bacterium]
MTAETGARTRKQPRPQSVSLALPAQHGAWGFWLEPALAGLIAAPSAAGVWLVLAGLSALLLHHPLMVAYKDLRRGRTFARTRTALLLAAIYAFVALAAFWMAHTQAEASFWPALVIALPFALVYFWHDLRNEARSLPAELCGTIAFAALAPASALAAGWPLIPALALWAVLIARAVTSVLYIRERLRLEKGKPADKALVNGAHAAGVVVLIMLAVLGAAPWLPVIGGLVLAARAWQGLSERRHTVPAKILGFRELAYGVLYALLTGIGYRMLY